MVNLNEVSTAIVAGVIAGIVYARGIIAQTASWGVQFVSSLPGRAVGVVAGIAGAVSAAVVDLASNAVTVAVGGLVGFLLGSVGFTRLVAGGLVIAIVLYVWRGSPDVEYDGLAVRLGAWFVAGYALVRILISQGV